MKTFEVGRTYKVNMGGHITVTKRTAQYITFAGNYTGRKKVSCDLFRSEYIMVGSIPGTSLKGMCFALHTTKGEMA